MAKFKFYAEQKCVLWWKSTLEIEADSEDKAREIAMETAVNGNLEDFDIEGEIIADTIQDLEIEQNEGLPTLELITAEGNTFWNNVEGELPL